MTYQRGPERAINWALALLVIGALAFGGGLVPFPNSDARTPSPAMAKTNGPSQISPLATLAVAGMKARAHFGNSVGISSDGSTAVVGAKQEGTGSVYIFLMPKTGWKSAITPSATLTEPHARPNDAFGSAVAVSGNGSVILVGAYNGVQGAQAFVFVRPKYGWATSSHATAILTWFGLKSGAGFGRSVALSQDGRTAIIGKVRVGNGGTVFVYRISASGWESTDTPAELRDTSNVIGSAVSTDRDGSVVAVHAEGASIGGGVRRTAGIIGGAVLFQRPDQGWKGNISPVVQLVPSSNLGVSNAFAKALALSADGTTLTAGDCVTGATWVYSEPSASWANGPYPHKRLASPASCESANVLEPVASNADGRRLALGVAGGNADGYIYDRPTSGWETSNAPNSVLRVAAGERPRSGLVRQFSMSADGRTLVAGGVVGSKVLVYRLK